LVVGYDKLAAEKADLQEALEQMGHQTEAALGAMREQYSAAKQAGELELEKAMEEVRRGGGGSVCGYFPRPHSPTSRLVSTACAAPAGLRLCSVL
jgi:hypothetical protein